MSLEVHAGGGSGGEGFRFGKVLQEVVAVGFALLKRGKDGELGETFAEFRVVRLLDSGGWAGFIWSSIRACRVAMH